jgi:hypothetical protein
MPPDEPPPGRDEDVDDRPRSELADYLVRPRGGREGGVGAMRRLLLAALAVLVLFIMTVPIMHLAQLAKRHQEARPPARLEVR